MLVFSCHCNSCRNISSSILLFLPFKNFLAECSLFWALFMQVNLQVKLTSQFLFSCLPNRLNSLTRYVGFLISWSLQAILQICSLCISVFRMKTDILVPSIFVVQT
ncbi:hypothetical protein PVAP13_9NG310573 [Panicum virgatum]|uniref:Uncharacterized protein n=1 Tax=Panicum virgatum TaxID=38727 RepID=A0A8T0MLG8_PANVG|nr:hypothetical protein PVAP13_9NG310573 [Panicum virgatum]